MDRRSFLKRTGIASLCPFLLRAKNNTENKKIEKKIINNKIPDLSLHEFFRRRYTGEDYHFTSEQLNSICKRSGSKENNFGRCKNIESFEKIYNKYIRGKIYLPADKFLKEFGFIFEREGETAYCSVGYKTILEFIIEKEMERQRKGLDYLHLRI